MAEPTKPCPLCGMKMVRRHYGNTASILYWWCAGCNRYDRITCPTDDARLWHEANAKEIDDGKE